MPVAVPKTTDFEILGLTANPTEADLRAAYKTLALKWHPDRHVTDKEEAQMKFVEINEAYRTLLKHLENQRKDGRRREHTDSQSSRWFTSSAHASSSASSASGMSSSSEEDLNRPHGDDRRPQYTSHHSSPRRARVSPQSKKHPSQCSYAHSHGYESDEWSDDDDFVKMKFAAFSDASKLRKNNHKAHIVGDPINPLRSPASKGNLAQDWIFPLQVTLDDLYFGARHHYRITRTLWSGKNETVRIDVDVLAGWQKGKQIRVPGGGNERKDGSFQDIVFIIEEAPHPRYRRVEDDLVYTIQVPWVDFHSRPRRDTGNDSEYSDSGTEEQEILVQGMNGEEFALPLPRTLVEGADGTRLIGAGMPIREREKVVGKGDLLVKWEFIFPETEKAQLSRWQNLKKAMHWRF
ncbi:hypothetical protein BKA93DRAFT_930346 [Sparassis latifolia]